MLFLIYNSNMGALNWLHGDKAKKLAAERESAEVKKARAKASYDNHRGVIAFHAIGLLQRITNPRLFDELSARLKEEQQIRLETDYNIEGKGRIE